MASVGKLGFFRDSFCREIRVFGDSFRREIRVFRDSFRRENSIFWLSREDQEKKSLGQKTISFYERKISLGQKTCIKRNLVPLHAFTWPLLSLHNFSCMDFI